MAGVSEYLMTSRGKVIEDDAMPEALPNMTIVAACT